MKRPLEWFRNVFIKTDGSQILFLAGLLIGLSTNLLVAGVAPRPIPTNWLSLSAASGAWLVSSLALTRVAWMLQQFHVIAGRETVLVEEVDEIRGRLVTAAIPTLTAWMLIGVATFLLGAGILVVQ